MVGGMSIVFGFERWALKINDDILKLIPPMIFLQTTMVMEIPVLLRMWLFFNSELFSHGEEEKTCWIVKLINFLSSFFFFLSFLLMFNLLLLPIWLQDSSYDAWNLCRFKITNPFMPYWVLQSKQKTKKAEREIFSQCLPQIKLKR